MEFKSLEEFDKTFFSAYGTQPVAYDPFLHEAAPPPPPKNSGPKSPRERVNAIVSWSIIGLLALALVMFVAPLAVGAKLLNVTSGSMSPKYNVNTLIWVFPTKFDKISVGDDVTYKLPTGINSTHRVIDIDKDTMVLTVKGIHNSEFAEHIEYGQVVGVVRFSIHGIGQVMAKISGESGIYITIMIILGIALLWGASFFYSKLKEGSLNVQRGGTNQNHQNGSH